jgi:hypothetical protein
VREQLGHPEWGVLALPIGSIRWLRLLALRFIIGVVFGGGLVSTTINRQQEDLHPASPTPIKQSAEGIPPSRQASVASPTTQERQSPQISGPNPGGALHSEPAALPTSPDTGNHAGKTQDVDAEVSGSKQPTSDPVSASLLPDHQQTERPANQNTPKKRELNARLNNPNSEDTANGTGKAQGRPKIGESEQSSYSDLAPDHEQTPERSTILNTPKKSSKSAGQSHADHPAPLFQSWWDGRKVADPQLRNSVAPKRAEELTPFFQPWWYARPSADRRLRGPG